MMGCFCRSARSVLLLKDLEVNRLGDLSRNWAQAVFRGSGWGWKGWMAMKKDGFQLQNMRFDGFLLGHLDV